MGALHDLARSVRRWLRFACAVATLVTIAAPSAFGMAAGPMLDRLGSLHEHVCKCGMKPGHCGCPECDRAEQQRLRDRRPDPVPTLKRDCERDGAAIAFAALPATVPGPSVSELPAARGERVPHRPVSAVGVHRFLDPPTPPPRLATA